MAADGDKSAIDPTDYEDGMKSPTAENWLVPDKLCALNCEGLQELVGDAFDAEIAKSVSALWIHQIRLLLEL